MLRVFTSFDYDHDEGLRILLVGQARNPNTPFELADWSVKEAFTGDWQAKVRDPLRRIDRMIVLCGENTHTATGVSSEIEIARAEGSPTTCSKLTAIARAQSRQPLYTTPCRNGRTRTSSG